MRLLKKYVTCIIAFFTPFNYLSPFVSFALTLPLCYSLDFTKKLQNERKEDFLYMAVSAYHVISKKVKNQILRQIEFLDTYVL